MKPEIKEEWIKRLRSGEIEQTTGQLGRPDGSRCCLGVLCDIAVEQKAIEPPILSSYSDGKSYLEYCFTSIGDLPLEVLDWADLQNEDPEVKDPDLPTTTICLSIANDEGMSFQKIADLIEKSPYLE